MDSDQLAAALAAHARWLENNPAGARADLREADLWGANLREANLQKADLQYANLRGADLQKADLDFSAWPFWCGTMGAITDDRLKIQLLAHVAVLAGDITDPDLVELLGSDLFRRVVTKCHRARELGLAAGGGGGEE